MTDRKDDTGKAAPRPGDGSRRPYATIDLQAKEVGADRGPAGAAGPGAAAGSARAGSRPEALPPPGARQRSGAQAALTRALRAARVWSLRAVRSRQFLSHVAAGVAGAALVLVASGLIGLIASGGGRVPPEVSARIAAVEKAVEKRTSALADDVVGKLGAANARLAQLEQRARTLAQVAEAQAKLAVEAKELEARIAAPALAERLAKLEAALAALSADDKSGRVAIAEGLAAKLAEIEKLAARVGETDKSSTARLDREVASLRSEAGALGQRIDSLKAGIDERLRSVASAQDLAPVLAKLAAFEQELKTFLQTEGERVANSRRVLLTLELANLKRALDRGDSYAKELDAVRKVAGDGVDLAVLERYSGNGLPTPAALGKDFRRYAHAAIDAEAETPDASVLDRLMAGAKSVVRLRKTGHGPDDASAEAIVGRMEAALKDGHIGEVLAQAKRLPPRAARALDEWLRKVEARHSADRAVADIEAALKASLSVPRPHAPHPSATEPKR
jgi:hypothetical protein